MVSLFGPWVRVVQVQRRDTFRGKMVHYEHPSLASVRMTRTLA
jgi:hypothetical protein